ncbi:expressed unknown protein [Seminavis robusta]|uniref:At2g23090-like zinc-binding domain-containing protein n=1 Tax=Seminavis robusta TaxID=568900 RepID=A0A9N8EG96_9STRA|nr:expressed unknown protein [Seminavis robusta]|eukprot:Sro1116_g242910.1 n/a (136) ;mRNA; f:26731-27138
MGKGSNVQKAQAARERNQKKMGKSDEERKAAQAKSKADAAAFMCLACRQTFMANARPPLLYQHVIAKHPAGTDPASCFPQLKDFDPNDPKGEKKPPAGGAGGPVKPKKTNKKKDDNLDALLDAGLGGNKKKGGKK